MISPDEDASEDALFWSVVSVMPHSLDVPFLESDSSAGNDFVNGLIDEFNSGTYPSWLAQLPETVQTYFMTRWLGAVLDSTDILGSLPTVVTALVLTKGSGRATSTVAGLATFA